MDFKKWQLLQEAMTLPLGVGGKQNMGLVHPWGSSYDEMGMDQNMGMGGMDQSGMAPNMGNQIEMPMKKKKKRLSPDMDNMNDMDNDNDEMDGDEEKDMDDEDDSDEEDDGNEDMDDDDVDPDEQFDDEESLEGDEEMPKKKPMMGKPHNNSAFMWGEWKQEKDGELFLEKGKKKCNMMKKMSDGCCAKCEKIGKTCPDCKKKSKNKDEECKQCKKFKSGKCPACKKKELKENLFTWEDYSRPTKIKNDEREWLKSLARQYGNPRRRFDDGLQEDILLPPPNTTLDEPPPGQPGYAPQTRLGMEKQPNVTESVKMLLKRIEELEKKLK